MIVFCYFFIPFFFLFFLFFFFFLLFSSLLFFFFFLPSFLLFFLSLNTSILGSTDARCFACFLPAALFPYAPFGGAPRTLVSATQAHREQSAAVSQFQRLATEFGLRVADISNFNTYLHSLGGQSGSIPPLMANPLIDHECISFVLPLMHNLRQVPNFSSDFDTRWNSLLP